MASNQRQSSLHAFLNCEELDKNLFRGQSRDFKTGQVYGGQVLGQAIKAAYKTVGDDRFIHSAHAYFLLRGDVNAPIIYEVDRSLDGGSFTSRRVVAIQHGRQIFHLSHAVLAYISDMGLLQSTLEPHELNEPDIRKRHQNVLMASLDHATWFHRPFKVDDWLFYECRVQSTGNGRGLAFGRIYDQQGTLVASTSQEGLIRLKR